MPSVGRVKVTEYWPVLLVELGEAPSDGEILRMFDAYDRAYARRERFCAITSSIKLRRLPSPATRQLIATKAKQHEDASKLWMLQSVVVISSTIVRGAMTAVTWLSPPVYPLAHAADLDTAVDIVQRALEGDGRNAPAELVALRNSTT